MDSKKLYSKHIRLIALAVFIAIFPIIAGNRYYIGVMTDVAIYAMIAIGLNLLMGYAGQISLGHAGFYGIGAYCSGLLNVRLGLSPWLTAIAAIILTACIAYVVGIPTLKLKGHYLAMATLGFGEVVYVVLSKLDWLTGDTSGLPGIKPFAIWNIKFNSSFVIGQYILAWLLVLIILILSLNITKSRVGRAFRAIHGSEVAARGMGIDIAKYKVQVFVLSAVYAAVAGCLHAHFRWFIGYPTFHLQTSVKLVTMVIIGGSGNIWGAVIGAVLLTWLPEWLTIAKEYDIMIYGALLMLVMIFTPSGIVGIFEKIPSFIRRIRTGKSSDMRTEEGA